MRAQNGEKVTAKELAEARAEVDLEAFAAVAAERAEVARKAKERADKIAALNKRVEAIKAENTLQVAREKLAAAMEDFGRVCGDYEVRRHAITGEIGSFSVNDQGEDLNSLRGNGQRMEKAKMKATVYRLALDKLRGYYGRIPWESADNF